MISHDFASGGQEQRSVFDRPGASEVARLNSETIHGIEALDSPGDRLRDAVHEEVNGYSGAMPKDKPGLCRLVDSFFCSAAGPTAVSAWLEDYIAFNEQILVANAVRRMLVIIRSQARPGLTCDAIAIAMGIHIGEGRSLEEIAKSHGITKQALSKRAIRICVELHLPASPLMRSEASRKSYQAKQLQRHAAARDAGLCNGSVASLKAKLAAARVHVNGEQLKRANAPDDNVELVAAFA